MDPNKPRNPGTVEWSGDNPGIYFKEDPDGDWTALGLYFRVTLSPYGRGHVMIVMDQPNEALGFPEANNICLWDNKELTDYLIRDYVSKFPSFLGKKGLDSMSYRQIDEVTSHAALPDHHTESIISQDLEVVMNWSNMGEPFAAEVAVESSATGEHEMYSVFLEARSAYISVNGERFGGSLTTRNFLGQEMSTAFMAISETWVKPQN